MADNQAFLSEEKASVFKNALNEHGYGFQYRVLKLAQDLYDSKEPLKKSDWIFEVAEFPVQVQEHETRIDFILRHKSPPPFFLLAECKRANPALKDWCFACAPFVRRNRSAEYCFLEHANIDNLSRFTAYAKGRSTAQNAYHIAFEVKTKEKGNRTTGKPGGGIEDATTQICRGLNGYIQFLSGNRQVLGTPATADFLPVVFTTASLWVTDIDLSSTDIKTGEVQFLEKNLKSASWVAYQYVQSPGLKYLVQQLERPSVIGEILDREYIRTIFIVNWSGIEEFLHWTSIDDSLHDLTL